MTPRIVDLSTPLYDGIRGLETEPKTTIDTEGYNTTTLHLYSHTSTHMDAPRHFVAGGDAIDEVDLRACVGSADVIDLTATEPNGVIGVEDLAHHESRIGAGRACCCAPTGACTWRPTISVRTAAYFAGAGALARGATGGAARRGDTVGGVGAAGP